MTWFSIIRTHGDVDANKLVHHIKRKRSGHASSFSVRCLVSMSLKQCNDSAFYKLRNEQLLNMIKIN